MPVVPRSLRALVLVTILVASAAGRPARAARNEVHVVMSQEPDGLDPIFASMVAGTIIRGAILHELTIRNDRWELIPQLAVEVPTVENGLIRLDEAGKQTTTFHIKPEAKWSDGVPLTADDFIFCWTVTMDPNQPVISRDTASRIETLEAPDPKTLIIHWKETYAYSSEYRVLRCVPAHILRPVYEKDPINYHKTAYNQAPVSSGPFRLESWVPGQKLVLVPNPHYYGSKPKLERITYHIVPNTNTAIAQLRGGAADVLSVLSISLDQALELEKLYKDQYQVNITLGLVWEHMDMNLDSPILSDLRVRQALLHGIDRQIISEALFEGRQPVADSFLPPRHYGYTPVLSGVTRDVAKAAALLEEAGWRPGPGGIRVDAKGQRLELIIETTAGNALREQVQQLFQAQLQDIGVDLKIQNLPAKVFFAERTRRREFPHLAMYAWTQSPVSDGLTLWASDMIPGKENNWVGQNMPGWRNEEVTRILHQIQITLPDSSRREMLHQVQKIWASELPSIPLFFRADVSVQIPGVRGYRPTGSLVPETWNCEEWHWAE